MYVKREKSTLETTFSTVEWLLHTIVTLAFTGTGILILPFVSIYTKGITDADYIVPAFAVLMTLAQAVYCLRLPYNIMVLAAGHYKQTQWSAIVEAAVNIFLSILLVFHYGLIGVAIGTLVAMLYRTIYLVWYLSRHILHRPIRYFMKHAIVDTISAAAICISTLWIVSQGGTYVSWIWMAVKVMSVGILEMILINGIFYRPMIKQTLALLLHRTKS